MGKYFFKGEASSLDLGAIVRGERRLTDVVDRLAQRPGWSRARAQGTVEEMVAVALHRVGEGFERSKSVLLDRVVDLRETIANVFHRVVRGGEVSQGGQAAKTVLDDIEKAFKELDDTLNKLRKPLEEMDLPTKDASEAGAQALKREIENVAPSQARQAARDITEDFAREGKKLKSRLKRKGFDILPDNSAVRKFADGTSATFRVNPSTHTYEVEIRNAVGEVTERFAEFDIRPRYKGRPSTTSVMNLHHGMQDDLMNAVFGKFKYHGDDAPTIWLRDGRAGSPHGMITDVQTGQRAVRTRPGTKYSDIREAAIGDLKMSKVPQDRIDAYLRAFDDFFRTTVLPNIPQKQRAGLLGTWVP